MSAIPLLRSAALLVIDMQNQFANVGKEIVESLNCTIESFRSLGRPVFFTRHGHDNPTTDEATNVLVDFWGVDDTIKTGSRAWEFIPELDVKPEDHILVGKSAYDAFYKTTLHKELQELGIETVVIGGVVTNLCCETTARSAFNHNYKVVMLSDGNAADNEQLQHCSLKLFKVGFGEVMTCKEAVKRIKQIQQLHGTPS